MKYVKVGSEVDAVRLTEEQVKSYIEFGNFPLGLQISKVITDGNYVSYEFISFGLSGIQRGFLGDWFVQEIDGKKYFVKNEDFFKLFCEQKQS